MIAQGRAKVGLQLWVHKTQGLFLYHYLLSVVFYFHRRTVNLLLSHPVDLEASGIPDM